MTPSTDTDAAEWVVPPADEEMGFYRVAKCHDYPA